MAFASPAQQVAVTAQTMQRREPAADYHDTAAENNGKCARPDNSLKLSARYRDPGSFRSAPKAEDDGRSIH